MIEPLMLRASASKDQRSRTRDLLILTVIALAVRLAWLRWGAWNAVDALDYLAIARNIAFHYVFSLETGAGPLLPTAHRPPLYPALIAALWWGDSAPVSAVLWLQAGLGAATVALVYLIARDRFNRTVAIIACAGMIFAPMTCLFGAAVLTETLFTFLLTLGIFLWGRERFLRAGIIFGLSLLTRPTLLPFLLVLAALSLLPQWRAHRRAYVTMLLMACAVSSVWVARNAIVFGHFIPIAASGWGTNLLVGTIETDTGGRVWTGTGWAPLNLETHPVTRTGAELNEVEKDRVRLRRALGRIADGPLHWLVVRAKQYPKLFIDNGDYLLGARNLPLREAIREPRPLVILTKTAFISGNLIVFALAAFGLFVERARFVSLGHIVLFPIFLSLVHLPMWIEPRYLVPAMPFVAILGARGAVRLVEIIRSADRKRMILSRVCAKA
ncbi:MAG TPA: glycosyltransferase family 39 protein [Pyrinomonadaceae bacterium]|nr:glycosyltransferase family 39 protein [Pyrinomonadaceae bacterium]